MQYTLENYYIFKLFKVEKLIKNNNKRQKKILIALFVYNVHIKLNKSVVFSERLKCC